MIAMGVVNVSAMVNLLIVSYRRSLASLGINLNRSSGHRNRPLMLQLGEIEKRRERIERAENEQLLQGQPAVDQRNQVALLGAEVEAIEVREELGGQLRHGQQAAGMSEQIADDRVADDFRVAAQRKVIRIRGPSLHEFLIG